MMNRFEMPYGARFLGSAASPDAAKSILFGIPMDFTCSFRAGTRLGPREIRFFSENLEDYSVAQGKRLSPNAFYDVGDVPMSFGDARASLQAIEACVDEILGAGKRPIALGGEHLVTAGIIAAMAKRYPDLVILQVDAHYDLREDYTGVRLSHATVMRQCWDLLGMSPTDDPPRLVQMGIRSGPEEEASFAAAHIPQLFPETERDLVEELKELALLWKGRPVYCTFDIDAVDPAFAPATGTPEAGGLSSRQALTFMRHLNLFDLKGFDLVEVSPPLDQSGITSALAANMIRELFIGLDA